jgi:hypothetical protein
MIPSIVPSAAPSFPATVFINEVGGNSSAGFVEVVYSSWLGRAIEDYHIYYYNSGGEVINDVSLPEASNDNETFGLVFTFVEYTDNKAETVGFALVSELAKNEEELLYFVSTEGVILGMEGPADGVNSTYIGVDAEGSGRVRLLSSRHLEDGNETVPLCMAAVGTGCSFDEFEFAMVPCTPGSPNVDQEFAACPGFETPEPTTSPGDRGAISDGAIAGISVGALTLITLVLLFTVVIRQGKNAEPTELATSNGKAEMANKTAEDAPPNEDAKETEPGTQVEDETPDQGEKKSFMGRLLGSD